ncbi:hypothetical protein ACFBZI_11415 [Moraxella sp. ZJ142]|uniref:hypothetical protein n=1 Tax=Moraxella marmotae TaxID=3344520 RepID=UPI0035D4099C
MNKNPPKSASFLKSANELGKKTQKSFVQNLKKKRLIIIILLAIGAGVWLFMHLNQPKPKTFEDFMQIAEETAEFEDYASDLSLAYKGQRAQLGDEAYDALVLGVPVDEDSPFYEYQKRTFGDAINESQTSIGVVQEHEAMIRAQGGITNLQDLQKFDTGVVQDKYARQQIQKSLSRFDAPLTEEQQLRQARLGAAEYD